MDSHKFERIGPVQVSIALNLDCGVLAPEITVPIVGVPRGGTTMAAAAVEALGIYLGPQEDLDRFHFEDQTMHSPDVAVQYRAVKNRNLLWPAWGWKDPTAITSLRTILFALRRPRVIVVCRDIVSTITGEMRFDTVNGIVPPRDFNYLLNATFRWNAALGDFLEKAWVPTLLVSYEQAIRNPELFLDDLVAFLGVEPTDEQREEARNRINGLGGYLVPEGAVEPEVAGEEIEEPGEEQSPETEAAEEEAEEA